MFDTSLAMSIRRFLSTPTCSASNSKCTPLLDSRACRAGICSCCSTVPERVGRDKLCRAARVLSQAAGTEFRLKSRTWKRRSPSLKAQEDDSATRLSPAMEASKFLSKIRRVIRLSYFSALRLGKGVESLFCFVDGFSRAQPHNSDRCDVDVTRQA